MQEQLTQTGSGNRLISPWDWLFTKHWTGARRLSDRRATLKKEAHFSYWAVLLIFASTAFWASIMSPQYSQADSVRYYRWLEDGAWLHRYPLQQFMFWVMTAVHPKTFTVYLISSASIPLLVLLYSFYRLRYSRTEQFLLIFFFTCSFYGVHFIVTFQRQFYAFSFFVLALSIRRGALLARAASLFSHAYAFALHLFWEVRRLSLRATMLTALAFVPVIFIASKVLDPSKFQAYSSAGGNSMLALALKEGLNIIYVAIVLFTLRRGSNSVRTLCAAFIGFAVPSLFWAAYAGLFVRVDYYFFPLIIALWPTHLDPKHRKLFRVAIIFSTVTGFALWISLNFTWMVYGIPSTFTLRGK